MGFRQGKYGGEEAGQLGQGLVGRWQGKWGSDVIAYKLEVLLASVVKLLAATIIP